MKSYPSYKPSQIQWIGEIPEHWISRRLRYFARICNGRDYRHIEVEEGGYPVYGTGGIFKRCSDYLHNKPSVLLGRKGTVDKPLFVEEPFWTSDTIYFTDIRDDIDPKYFYYLTTQIPFGFYIYGSAVPSMTKEDYDDINFCYPPLPEQTAIADFLDRKTTSIDQIIADKERLIALYEEEKKALINEAITKGINPNVKMKDSGIEWLGEISEHWEVKKLKYITTKIGSGVTPKGGSDVYQTEGVPLLRSQNIYNDGLRLDDVAYIDEATHVGMKGSQVLSDDVLLNITGASLGRCYFFTGELGEANVNQHVCIIRLTDQANYRFIHYLIISEPIRLQIANSQTGSGREGLNFERLANFFLVLPDTSEQARIVNYLDSKTSTISDQIKRTYKEIDLLKEYRQSLIFEAVTGKIDVRSN